MSIKHQKIEEAVLHSAAEFIQRESSGQSLITVTRSALSDDGKTMTIFVSVLPEEKEKVALDFLKRQRAALRHHIKENVRVQHIPFLDVEIDYGEKNRQKIARLIQEK